MTSLRDLISNPVSGRLSTSDTIVFFAFLVSSFLLVWVTVKTTEIPSELYFAYLSAWVTQSQVSKHMSIKRAKEVPGVVSNPETPQG
ncbi:DUF2644 domain-containing protein [Candidatus Pantoea formicae]|uniref:DUF2644 domain-containing protein n=1 Tax=Candidatus Pantoea formicae TaxID=2608355 RepID=UPI003EDA116A